MNLSADPRITPQANGEQQRKQPIREEGRSGVSLSLSLSLHIPDNNWPLINHREWVTFIRSESSQSKWGRGREEAVKIAVRPATRGPYTPIPNVLLVRYYLDCALGF